MLRLVAGAAIGLLWIIPSIIVGLVACFFFGIFGEDDLLAYAIWFVLGIFTGLFVFTSGGEWVIGAKEPGQKDILPHLARPLFLIQLVMLAGLGLLLHGRLWRDGSFGDLHVPGSMPHTLTFFVSMAAAMWLARLMSIDAGAEKIKAATIARWRGRTRSR